MEYLSNTDIFILKASAAGLALACAKSQITKWTRSAVKPAEFPLLTKKNSENQKALVPTRKIKKQLEQTKKIVSSSTAVKPEQRKARPSTCQRRKYEIQSAVLGGRPG